MTDPLVEEAKRLSAMKFPANTGYSDEHHRTVENFVVGARCLIPELVQRLERAEEALKAIGEVAFVANEGDPYYCELEGIDVERAYRLYREALALPAADNEDRPT